MNVPDNFGAFLTYEVVTNLKRPDRVLLSQVPYI